METNIIEEIKTEEQQPSLEEIKNKVIEVIKKIYDPEIPVNIYELGLIYDIEVTANYEVVILMTLTAPNCPEAEYIPVQVDFDVKRIQGVKDVKVILTFDPPWDKDRMTEDAKMILGIF
jgi:FeS assembly SUF system protein